jgi:uncharacterized protein (TIGR02246 family)
MSIEAEISSLQSRLMQAVDHQDRATFADCWTEDLDFELVMFDGQVMKLTSRDQLLDFACANWAGQASSLRHLVAAVWVEAEGPDRAVARFYCHYLKVGAEPSLAGMGEYRDILRRGADGRWRVAVRRHVFLTPLDH